MTVRSSASKRLSLLNRTHKKTQSNEKNPVSGDPQEPPLDGSEDPENGHEPEKTVEDDVEEEDDHGRKLYFNVPLPPEMKDEDGSPIQTYPRNKIRTAKYTPLSFIPKNLWFQFHNVANIFFLFLVILVVSCFV